MDTVDAKTRSGIMSAIRGKDTKPELLLRSLLHRSGLRFRLHAKDLPGKPDIVLPKHRAVIQMHGCFWHGHDCARFKLPKTRKQFWFQKISKNRARDLESTQALLDMGWRVAVIWECAVLPENGHRIVHKVHRWLASRRKTLTHPAPKRARHAGR